MTADAVSATIAGPPGTGRPRWPADGRTLAGVAGVARYLNADAAVTCLSTAALALLAGPGSVAFLASRAPHPVRGEDRPATAPRTARRRFR